MKVNDKNLKFATATMRLQMKKREELQPVNLAEVFGARGITFTGEGDNM
ncbi:MAG: hypothetical protein ACLRFI_00850 [Alphaproteobacteria bacterium]